MSNYDTPVKLQRETQILKDGVLEYPGWVNFSNKGGEYFHGSRVAHFKNVDDLNAFFEPGGLGNNKLAGEIMPLPDGSVVCVYTNKLSAEDMDDLEEFHREMHAFMANKKAEREAKRAEAKAQEEKNHQEMLENARIGAKYKARVARIKEIVDAKERKAAMKELNSGVLKDE